MQLHACLLHRQQHADCLRPAASVKLLMSSSFIDTTLLKHVLNGVLCTSWLFVVLVLQKDRVIQEAAEHYVALSEALKAEELPHGTQVNYSTAHTAFGCVWAAFVYSFSFLRQVLFVHLFSSCPAFVPDWVHAAFDWHNR